MGFSAQVQRPQTSGGKGSPPQTFQQTPDSVANQSVSLRPDGLDQNAINANPAGYQQFRQNAAQQGYNYGPQDMSTQDLAPVAPQPQVMAGKGASGQRFTYSPTSGQPQMGRPNQYTNTVGQWDNASIMPQPVQRSGKGKGG
jgi:hypothetical protein